MKFWGRNTEDDSNTNKGKVFYMQIDRCTALNKHTDRDCATEKQITQFINGLTVNSFSH